MLFRLSYKPRIVQHAICMCLIIVSLTANRVLLLYILLEALINSLNERCIGLVLKLGWVNVHDRIKCVTLSLGHTGHQIKNE